MSTLLSDQHLGELWGYNFAVLLVLVLVVWWVMHSRVSALEAHHKDAAEGMSNPYAARPPQVASDSLLGSRPGGSEWGQILGDKRESFFGSQEAPTFYDIGDVRTTRSARQSGADAKEQYVQWQPAEGYQDRDLLNAAM